MKVFNRKAAACALCVCVLLSLILLASCAATKRETVAGQDGYSFTLEYRGDTVVGFEVLFEGNRKSSYKVNGRNFTLVDMNFDGISDIRLDNVKSEDGDYICFIFQQNVGLFSKNRALGELFAPVWDNESKTIKSTVRKTEFCTTEKCDVPITYEETRSEAVWNWQNGMLTCIAESGITYYSESGMYCKFVCKFDNGELVRDESSEKWFRSLGDLEAHGYTW